MSTTRSWTQKGTPDRIDEILDAAIELLIADGFAQFSLRKVASEVGVGLATIQYHFGDRENLLRRAITRIMVEWGQDFSAILEDRVRTPEARLNALHERGLLYIDDHKTTPLLFELFAAALRDPALLKLVRAGYQALRASVAGVLREVRPDLPDAEIIAFATLIPATMEGLNLYMQSDDPARPDDTLIRQVLAAEIAGLLGALRAFDSKEGREQ